MAKKKPKEDPAMKEIRRRFEASGLSLQELGEKMDYKGPAARKSAWQFLNHTSDPKISMIRKFAAALKIPAKKLI